MDDVKSADILLVVASGNEGLNLDKEGKAWPAAFAKQPSSAKEPDYSGNILSVGAWNNHPDSLKICYFSNFGSFVDIYALGTRVVSTGLTNSIVMGQGTSYAAPYVARTAAMLRGLYPRIEAKCIKEHIKTYANSVTPSGTSRFGIKLHNDIEVMEAHERILSDCK